MKVRAAVLNAMGAEHPYAKSKPLAIEEVELKPRAGRDPRSHGRRGLCHSDLSVINGDRPRPTPMALGHEAAGVVEALGAGVDDLKKGDHVVLVFVPSCGHCAPCAEGRPALCEPGAVANTAGTLLSGERRIFRTDGKPVYHHMGCSAFAEAAVVSRRSAVKIDPELPLDEAALFGCAVLTGVGAVVNTAQVRAGSTVAVIGLGGVGLASLLGADASGARAIVAIDMSDEKLALAKKLGATHTFNATDADLVQKVKDATRGGVDFAIEMAGSVRAFETALQGHAPRRHHDHRGPSAADGDVGHAVHESRRGGAHHQGKLHRHLRAVTRSAALHRPLSPGQAPGEQAHDGQAQARADQRRLRPAARRARPFARW
jgi:alcohol dehydrogenase